jgi:hypothetical protein
VIAVVATRGLGKTARVNIPRHVLQHLYVDRLLSTIEIGRLLKCSKKTVRLRLLEYGFTLRSAVEAFAASTTHAMALKAGGSKHPAWRGGTRTKCGYQMVWSKGHPEADASGYVFVHRLVAAEKLGRSLRDDEHVHHINEDRQDNRPENITVMTQSEHMSLHMRERHAAGKIPYRRRKACQPV